MLEIKLLNFYIRKCWFLLFLMVVFQIIMFVFFLINLLSITDVKLSGGLWKFVYVYSNFDLIFLGVFLFPIMQKMINHNDFYKNYLLKNRNYFRSSLTIFLYFLAISLFIVFIRKIFYYSIENAFISKYYQGKISFTNFESSLFGEVHLALSSILVGKIISYVYIRKSFVFYLLLTLVFLLILITFAFFMPFFLIDFSSAAVSAIPTGLKNTMYWIRNFLEATPLAGGLIFMYSSARGLNFDGVLNFKKPPFTSFLRFTSINHSLVIWIIVSFFVYILVFLIMFYIDKTKYMGLKNYVNSYLWKRKTKRKNV